MHHDGMSEQTALHGYDTDFPGWIDMKQVDLGMIDVNVADIIGGNGFANDAYQENWEPKPIEFDYRYERAESFVKDRMKEHGKGKKKALDLDYIHLFRFWSEIEKKHVYYVCNDGHRRVSCAHRLGVTRIRAEVTDLLTK